MGLVWSASVFMRDILLLVVEGDSGLIVTLVETGKGVVKGGVVPEGVAGKLGLPGEVMLI